LLMKHAMRRLSRQPSRLNQSTNRDEP
jgi:hypothetical protein